MISANSNDPIHQGNMSEENMEQIVRELMFQKLKGLQLSPSFTALILFAFIMLVLGCFISIIKKCNVKKASLKRCKKPKDNYRVKHSLKSLKEILDELEAGKSDDEIHDDKYGRILFKCYYEFKKEIFMIDILSAEDLLPIQANVHINPFVTIYFTPSQKIKFKTSSVKHTINPYWEERFKFENMPLMDLLQQTLVLEVRDQAISGKSPVIGLGYIPVKTIDMRDGKEMIYPLVSPTIGTETDNVGRMNITLRYVPTASKLYVVIVELDNLARKDRKGLSDPYVKVVLNRKNKHLFKGKTSVKKQTLDPYFNESFVITMPSNFVETVELCISVYDKDKVGKDIIGFVSMGCSCKDLGLTHWLEILSNPRKSVNYWHKLNKDIKK